MKWKPIEITEKDSPEQCLVLYMNRSSYFRRANPEKEKKLKRKYHKGFEVRIGCYEDEIPLIVDICGKLKIKCGKPYKSRNRYILPIYGAISFYRIKKMILDYS